MNLFTQFIRLRVLLKKRAWIFLSSAAGILIILSVIVNVVYTSFQNIALHSLSLSNGEFAAQTDALSDLMATMVRNYGMNVFYSPSVTRLREEKDLDNYERVLNIRELEAYVSSSEYIDSIYVYNQASGYVYTTDSDVVSGPVDTFADASAGRLFLSLNSDMKLHPIRRVAFEGMKYKEKECYSFLFFETTQRDEPCGNALMINVSYDWYVGTLLAFDRQNSCVLIDGRGAIVAANSDVLKRRAVAFERDILSSEAGECSYILKDMEDTTFVCHYSYMESSGWYCLRILSLDESIPGLLQFRDGLIAWIIVGFLILIVAFILTMIVIYFPFQKIRKILLQAGTQYKAPDQQAIQLVQDSLQHQKERLFIELMEGRVTEQAKEIKTPITIVMVKTSTPDQAEKLVLEACPKALSGRQNGCEVFILSQVPLDEIQRLCNSLVENCDAQCCYSEEREQLYELPECFEALWELWQLRFWWPEQRILSERARKDEEGKEKNTEKQDALLISALRSGDLEQSRRVWKEILFSTEAENYQNQVFIFRGMAALLEEMQPSLKPLLANDFFEHLDNISVLNERFEYGFRKIIEANNKQRRDRLDNLSAKVVQRIDSEYADINLSPTQIAEELGLSSGYLGKLFRESLNMSISEYLNQTRISQAERLLQTTELSVESVAKEVGFGNVKYFYVVFKKITGQTPLQYRKRLNS